MLTRSMNRSIAAAHGAYNYVQVSFTAHSRGRTSKSNSNLQHKLRTPGITGGRQRSPHGTDCTAVYPV